MGKISLVISNEYRTRVMKKSFILLTLLMPIAFAAIIFTPVWLAKNTTEIQDIALVDNDGRFSDIWHDCEEYDIRFDKSQNTNAENAIQVINESNLAAVAIINPKDTDEVSLTIISDKTLPSAVIKYIESKIENTVTDERLAKIASKELLSEIDNAEYHIEAQTVKCSEDGTVEEGAKADIAMVIGMVATMLIYMFIFISGAQVMNAVMQEKTNRIVEVMLSSIKPWELMWGKLISVALVSLTQIAIWMIFTLIIIIGVGSLMGGDVAEMANSTSALQQSGGITLPSELSMFVGIDWGFILFWFLLYFLVGYLLYAALFAAMGAAVDNEADTQQFMLPITAIVLFALYAGIFSAENPDGGLAFWCSMIPFTSPIVMMVRLPFGVAWWELAVSFASLIISVVAVAWASSKIYRVGILMYGKKPSWKELWKWLRY